MPFEVSLTGADAALARVDKMLAKLQALPVADELVAWQRDDMRRHFPNTESTTNPISATTSIWPRSRKQYVPKRGAVRRAKPLRRGKATRIPKPAAHAHRPILRPELFTKLCERMRALMQRELKW